MKTALISHFEKIPAQGKAPIEVFQNLNGTKKFLLESTFSHPEKGKFSFLGMNPYEEVTGKGGITTVINLETKERMTKNQPALSYLEEQLPVLESEIPLPFSGGAVGYIGYDAIRDFQDIGKLIDDELEMPDIHFMLFKDLIVFDHQEDIIYLIVADIAEHAFTNRIQFLKDLLIQNTPRPKSVEDIQFKAAETETSFKEKIAEAKQHIANKEVLQIVLSQRLQAEVENEAQFAQSFYERLREKNPSPYMYYIDFEDYILLGASPESLLQVTGREVTTNPIAGTRPRGTTAAEDKRLEKELLTDEKELTEHEMLVALSKADLARVCLADSIQVTTDRVVEKYQHVMHIVSEVKGRLQEKLTAMDALKSCLPAGTVSGMPKLRAMQIINELEDSMRGPYGGGVGYINFNRDMNIALTIRSLVVKEGHAYLQAGAGIISASVPQTEYEETLHKARSILEAARVTQTK